MAESLTEHVGALSSPQFVNQKDALNSIEQAVRARDRSSPVFYITAPGGMGKTRLAREVLSRCQPQSAWERPDLLAASEVVDLYHSQTHSMEGLARAIRAVLRPGPGYFAKYESRLKRFERDRRDLAGITRELSAERDRVAEAFVDDMNALAEKYRLVLVLDTAEKLLYETDSVQKALGAKRESAAVLSWLLDKFLPQITNTVIIIAGRPSPAQLGRDLRRVLQARLFGVRLKELGKKDVDAYLTAIAQAARQGKQILAAKRIDAITSDTREVIWRYTGGRPILVSLLVDYLLTADTLLPEIGEDVRVVRRKRKEELRKIRDSVEADIVRVLQETGRSTDDAIRSLAWTRKGMDAELFHRVMGLPIEDASRVLTELRQLSFVKWRPADKRVFLHDEMYALLWKHVLQRLPEAHKQRVLSNITAYYAERVESARSEIERLRRLGAEERELEDATVRLYTLMAEHVHYGFLKNPGDGFKTYCQYADESFWANSDELDMMLRNEVLEFLGEWPKGQERFDSLSRSTIELDQGMRWISRYNGRAEYERAQRSVRRLRARCDSLLRQDPLAKANSDSLDAFALTYSGSRLEVAEGLLSSSTASLHDFGSESALAMWRRNVYLANGLNLLGYQRRIAGRYVEAINAYREALVLWRTLGRVAIAQQANTLNNLAWAYACVGKFQDALRHCQDALQIRQDLGHRAPVAFSLNTLGMILTQNDQPERGRSNCERALGIFQDMEYPRGVGISSYALAEALRRAADAPEMRIRDSADLVRQAQALASHAVEVFTNTVHDRSRLVEALIELGCVYRDWARLRPLYDRETTDPDRDAIALDAEAALRRAIREAETEKELSHRAVQAQVNLAWLYHYVGQDDRASAELRRAIAHVGPEYLITQHSGLPKRDLPVSYFWVQLGKAHLLLGEIAMAEYRSITHLDKLTEAARMYTLSLAYDRLYAPDFRDMRRGKDRIYDNFKTLKAEEFPAVYKSVSDTEQAFRMQSPSLMSSFLLESFGDLNAMSGAVR